MYSSTAVTFEMAHRLCLSSACDNLVSYVVQWQQLSDCCFLILGMLELLMFFLDCSFFCNIFS